MLLFYKRVSIQRGFRAGFKTWGRWVGMDELNEMSRINETDRWN